MRTLKEYHDDWIERMKNSEFISECILDEAEVRDLGNLIRKNINIDEPFLYPDLVVLLAVNCAYYFYDDAGFWEHFCKIINLPKNDQNKKYLGNMIEELLKKLESLEF